MPEVLTPIRQQYLEIKRSYPNAILFFRLGDFYETFDKDAEVTSRELDIVLTSRNVAKGKRVPMAGIPYHAIENYLSRLIDKGYHVAICEQVGDQPAKGLFPREVVRVVTPGTVIEPGLLHSDRNNYLVAISLVENRAGIAYVDITTGEFLAAQFEEVDIFNLVRAELARLKPAEVLLPDKTTLPDDLSINQTTWPVWRFEYSRCLDILQRHFQVNTLDGFGLRGMELAIQSAGAILQYLQETQPSSLNLLGSISTYQLDEFMVLDSTTRRNLELTETIRQGDVQGSLLGVLDQTITPMGKRLLRQWVSKPLRDLKAIHARQERVSLFFKNSLLRAEIRAVMRKMNDLERLTNRVVSGHSLPRDLVSIRITLGILPEIEKLLNIEASALEPLLEEFHLCKDEYNLLCSSISEDPPATLQSIGVIRNGFSSELDQVIEASRQAREWIANLESIERERTGIKSLKVGYNKVFGYYIEITNSNTASVPTEYIRKQTLVNAERYITPEMKEYETLVLNAEERIRDLEGRLFREVCHTLITNSKLLLETARFLATVDVLAALAETASMNNFTRPEVIDEKTLEIHDGRHPVVEQLLKDDRFVPNDTIFEQGEFFRIITGPNMSGKSTFLRQTALIVLLAQMGSYVPASSARIGIVDRIFTRIGAQDEIHAGHSTFMVEMIETANILNHASSRSLLILDEIGRGTSTYDGVSIAWAVVEYLHNHPELRPRTLFATHYHELTQLAELLPGVRNYNVAVTESDGQVVFLHRIVPGGADRSYGIHVAQLAGLPRPVIQRADAILHQLEASSGRAVSLHPGSSQQMALFPETNPLVKEIGDIDINTLSPIEALNKLFEWKKKYSQPENCKTKNQSQ